MISRSVIVAVAAAVCLGLLAQAAQAQSNGSLTNNLFSQYYTQPGASSATAGMYPAPHPVPRHVGSSSYTYQPLMPHEMMYAHQRNYYNYYGAPNYYGSRYGWNNGGGGLTKTTVVWQNGCNHMGPLPGNGHLATWQYAWQQYLYCIQNGGGNCNQYLGGSRSGRLRGHFGQSGGCAGGECDSYAGADYFGSGAGCASCAQADGGTLDR